MHGPYKITEGAVKTAELLIPELISDEAKVRMEYSPINPIELRFMDGVFGRSELPEVPRMENVVVIQSIGTSVSPI